MTFQQFLRNTRVSVASAREHLIAWSDVYDQILFDVICILQQHYLNRAARPRIWR